MSAVRDAADVTIVKGACPHDCPDACALDIHLYGTTRPSLIRANYGMQRARGGGMPPRGMTAQGFPP